MGGTGRRPGWWEHSEGAGLRFPEIEEVGGARYYWALQLKVAFMLSAGESLRKLMRAECEGEWGRHIMF